MAKRRKQITEQEVLVAKVFRTNHDLWLTHKQVENQVGDRAAARSVRSHVNHLVQVGVLQEVRTHPDHTFRWATKPNEKYVQRLLQAAEIYDSAGKFDQARPTIVTPTVTPEPEFLVPEIEDDEDSEPLTPSQLKLAAEYERKIALVSTLGKNGRFLKHNLVWHPEYGSGQVEGQHGSKQSEVKFHRPFGKLVVMEADLALDEAAIAQVELLNCTECGKPFPRNDRKGRYPMYCSQVCRNRRNTRVRAEATAKAAEKAKAKAEKEIEALQAPDPQPRPAKSQHHLEVVIEPPETTVAQQTAALVSEVAQSPVYEGKHGTHVDIVLRMADGQPKTAKFLSVEDAINYLMEKL